MSGAEDYRDSHIERGGVYDSNLLESPFDNYMAIHERRILSKVIPDTFPNGVDRYLDFACGTGRITQLVSSYAKQPMAVDISESMLARAREKCPGVTFHLADLTKDKVDFDPFDLVTSFRFFGNAQQELRESVIAVLKGLVKPGGYLIVNNHRNPDSFAAKFHKISGGVMEMDLTHRKFDFLLQSNGFEIVKKYPIGVWAYRSKIMNSLKGHGKKETLMESLFSSSIFSNVAPDAILLARKI